jgi:peroxiredoxin
MTACNQRRRHRHAAAHSKETSMTIAIGQRIPPATLVKVTDDGPESIDSDAFFAGRTVALFAVPGAFTPTCSAKHLPSFVEHLDELKAKGVDEIACTSVNDAFVMKAWAKQGDAAGITMLADGNADFARALGLSTDSSRFGMGIRSQRYSMLVEDGVVKQLNVEQPGEFRVSSGDYLLGAL